MVGPQERSHAGVVRENKSPIQTTRMIPVKGKGEKDRGHVVLKDVKGSATTIGDDVGGNRMTTKEEGSVLGDSELDSIVMGLGKKNLHKFASNLCRENVLKVHKIACIVMMLCLQK